MRKLTGVVVTLILALAALTVSTPATAAERADFYTYSGSQPLSSYPPGAVLDTRTLPYRLANVPLPLKAVQILYRSTDQLGRPIAAVTTVVKPLTPRPKGAVSYQSFYDSLDPEHGPSRAIAGGKPTLGGAIPTVETALIVPFLLQGYAVVVPDTQGPDADFAAGPQYGQITLDSLRAASATPATGLTDRTKLGLVGYSGGAIATGWAVALAPSYAPEINDRIVGAAEGGVLVNPATNLDYISGTPVWGGVGAMAVVGVARAFDIDFSPYLSADGESLVARLEKASIANVLGQYPNVTWQRLAKPEFANPNSVKPYVDAVNELNMGSAPTPTVPMLIHQGTGGDLEGTPGNKPGIGPGDGVMVAGDVRSLARQYCADGTSITYRQTPLSHIGAAVPWATETVPWMAARFATGREPATDSCGRIAEGNSLAPQVYEP